MYSVRAQYTVPRPSPRGIPCPSPTEGGRSREVNSVQKRAVSEDSLGWFHSRGLVSGIILILTLCLLANSRHRWEGRHRPGSDRGSQLTLRICLCGGRVGNSSGWPSQGAPSHSPLCCLFWGTSEARPGFRMKQPRVWTPFPHLPAMWPLR